MKQELQLRQLIREFIEKIFEAGEVEGEMGDTIDFFDKYEKDQEEYLKSMVDKAKAELRTASSKKVAGDRFKDLNTKNIAQKRAEQSAWEKTERDFKKFSDNLTKSKEYIQQLQQMNSELQQGAEEEDTKTAETPETPETPPEIV